MMWRVLLYTSGRPASKRDPLLPTGNLLSLFNAGMRPLPWNLKDENLSFLPPAGLEGTNLYCGAKFSKRIVVKFMKKEIAQLVRLI